MMINFLSPTFKFKLNIYLPKIIYYHFLYFSFYFGLHNLYAVKSRDNAGLVSYSFQILNFHKDNNSVCKCKYEFSFQGVF